MPVRRKNYRPARGRRESLWQKRATTIKYLLFVLGGLLLGSLAAVLCGVEAIPCRILVNQLTVIPQRGLWALWRERLLFMAILLLYLLIAGRCLWGSGMIPAAPLLFGIGQGTEVTFMLMLLGWSGIGYILLAVVLPRTIELAALILLCNLSQSACARLKNSEDGAAQTMLWAAGAALLVIGALLEAIMKAKMVTGIL